MKAHAAAFLCTGLFAEFRVLVEGFFHAAVKNNLALLQENAAFADLSDISAVTYIQNSNILADKLTDFCLTFFLEEYPDSY